LHPNAQRTLYRQLKNIAGQKIISTHSPYIAGQAELEELRHFYKVEDKVAITQIDFNQLRPEHRQKVKQHIESSKGEILFSNIVVMCEGETEEILLPIFAKAYWGVSDFELGVDFTKTGKYYPLLYLLRFLKIEWFIFSDYDKPDVKTALQSVLANSGITSLENVVKLNDETTEKDIEEYLFDNGYALELRNALKQIKEPMYANEQHRIAKRKDVEAENRRIDGLSKVDFIKELDSWKTKVAPIYANLILQRTDVSTRFPIKIQELFTKMNSKIRH
jgi:putative ATP-dependent endonuclease of the OLD family